MLFNLVVSRSKSPSVIKISKNPLRTLTMRAQLLDSILGITFNVDMSFLGVQKYSECVKECLDNTVII